MRRDYAVESLGALNVEPSQCLISSTDVGWYSGLLRVYRSRAECGPFETVATPDQTLVMHLTGRSEVKCLAGGIWRTSLAAPGSIGLTPGSETSRLRWRCLDEDGYVSAHLHLPQALIAEAGEHYRKLGRSGASPLNALSVKESAISAVVGAVVRGLRAGESDLFAETLFVELAARLVDPERQSAINADDRRHPGMLEDRRLRRALDLMTVDLSTPVTLDMIAREAGISKFHFVRMFRRVIGCPPHAFLTGVRLDTALEMMKTCDLPIATIAALVGYPVARNFTTAFRRRFSNSPASFRHKAPIVFGNNSQTMTLEPFA